MYNTTAFKGSWDSLVHIKGALDNRDRIFCFQNFSKKYFDKGAYISPLARVGYWNNEVYYDIRPTEMVT